MSLASSAAQVLRDDPVGRIGFAVETVAVDKTGMASVAKAIDAHDIAVATGSTGSQLGAAYSSLKTARVADGERKLIGRITVSSADVVLKPIGRAAIFHESVHALMDVKGVTISMHNDEVVAYLADAMYLRATKTTVEGDRLAKAIFEAAFALVDGRRMLDKPGVSLKWTDCDALRDAIKAHPAYH